MKKPSIAIVGAGFSGIVLAQKLKNIGEVKIFEKARGVGGRMASRIKDDFNFAHSLNFSDSNLMSNSKLFGFQSFS
jgi:predicted NAD/FAD-dependent oxidoreductase